MYFAKDRSIDNSDCDRNDNMIKRERNCVAMIALVFLTANSAHAVSTDDNCWVEPGRLKVRVDGVVVPTQQPVCRDVFVCSDGTKIPFGPYYICLPAA